VENKSLVLKEPSAFYRWMVLLFVSIAMYGNYYIYNIIAPDADLLVKFLHFSDSDIGLLQAIYSIPNVFMVLIGGIIIDKIGTRISTFVFTFLCLIGAILTAITGNLAVMAAGRLVFGLGAESMIVAITVILGRWFKGKELSFAFGLNITVARFGTYSAMNSPTWAKALYTGWQPPLFIGVAAGALSLIAIGIYWWIEKHTEKKFLIDKSAGTDKFIFKEIFTFGKSYWYVVLLCVTFYSATLPFETFAVKFFMDTRDITRELSGFLVSILTLAAMVLTPLFGLFSDFFGKRALLMMIGSFLIMPVFLIMSYTHLSLYIPMIIMGISFALIPAVMWPAVTIIVPEKKLGTAYGLMTMIQNIGLAAFNLMIGWANDVSSASSTNPSGYNLGMWIFTSLGFFGLVFALLLRKSEMGPKGHGLELSMKKQKKLASESES